MKSLFDESLAAGDLVFLGVDTILTADDGHSYRLGMSDLFPVVEVRADVVSVMVDEEENFAMWVKRA